MKSFLLNLTVMTVIISMGAALRQIAVEVHSDGYWPRLGFVALFPIQIVFTLFFSQVFFGSIAQMFGPIRQVYGISKYYSGQLPAKLGSTSLPHVTIQWPVYQEGLEAVIIPAVRSLKEAMTTY